MSQAIQFPPTPSDYDFSRHFTEDVIEDGNRYMTWQRTFDTIRNGEISDADGNADKEWCKDYQGVKVYVLVGWNGKEQIPVVITGWPAVHDPRQAVRSGKWNEQQLRDIHQFNDGVSLESDFRYP